MKKVLNLLLALLLALGCALLVTACGEGGDPTDPDQPGMTDPTDPDDPGGDPDQPKPAPVPVVTENGITYTLSDDGTYYTVSDADASLSSAAIAETLYDLPVTSIGYDAFYRCTSLASVTIPDSVTSIGDEAFYGCDSLASVTIGDGVTSIGSDAFSNTAYYNEESNWENGVLYIGNHLIEARDTFSGAYTIKAGTRTIAGSAFRFCTSLASITIPGSVTSIGEYAFYMCTSLASITIPDSVTSIGMMAFYGCRSLVSITVDPANAVYHSDGNCLIEIVSKTLIAGCNTSVIPSDGSVTSIGEDAFRGCDSLASVTIPDGVTYIGEDAFSSCDSLASVTIPDSVTSIGSSVFSYCSSLAVVYYKGTPAEWGKIGIGIHNSVLTNATRYYYSETQPTGSGKYNYWHYVDGVPTAW